MSVVVEAYILKFPPTKNLRPILAVVEYSWYRRGSNCLQALIRVA